MERARRHTSSARRSEGFGVNALRRYAAGFEAVLDVGHESHRTAQVVVGVRGVDEVADDLGRDATLDVVVRTELIVRTGSAVRHAADIE